MDKKISIVSAFYNRRKLFINTLKTIEKSLYKDDIEVIVVDDGSIDTERIDDLVDKTSLSLKVIRIEPKDKWWKNPCIPYNRGFKKVTSNIILIQNPECLHFGDIVKYSIENIKDGDYLSFGCYSVDEKIVKQINKMNLDSPTWINQIGRIVTPLTMRGIVKDGENAWYNHSIHRPQYLHFCSAITRNDIEDLGGFDERFSMGIAFDDNDFVLRIQRKGMKIIPIDRPFVMHQYHGNTNYVNNQDLYMKNYQLFQTIMNEKTYKVNNK